MFLLTSSNRKIPVFLRGKFLDGAGEKIIRLEERIQVQVCSPELSQACSSLTRAWPSLRSAWQRWWHGAAPVPALHHVPGCHPQAVNDPSHGSWCPSCFSAGQAVLLSSCRHLHVLEAGRTSEKAEHRSN